jgi:phosphatidylglycerol:prolipoprotein diacylglycerol transferase
MYIAWYGIGRAYIEGLRTDSLMLYNYRISQLLSLILVVIAIACLILIRTGVWEKWAENLSVRKAKREGVYNPVYKPLLENQPKNFIAGENNTADKTKELSEENNISGSPVSEDEAKAYFEAKAEELKKENVEKEKNNDNSNNNSTNDNNENK